MAKSIFERSHSLALLLVFCNTASKLKPYCALNSVNPYQTSLLFDPWYMETPLAFNPTYFNSNLDFEVLRITDFILNDRWDFHKLRDLFGDSLESISNRLGHIDSNAPCYWTWTPKSHSNKISSMT